jgi:hypothetical protein
LPLYRVVIEGRNFPARKLAEPARRFGFFTTRCCEAQDEQAAEQAVVDALRAEFREMMILDDGEFTPSFHLDEIEPLAELPDDCPDSGAVWYPEG